MRPLSAVIYPRKVWGLWPTKNGLLLHFRLNGHLIRFCCVKKSIFISSIDEPVSFNFRDFYARAGSL